MHKCLGVLMFSLYCCCFVLSYYCSGAEEVAQWVKHFLFSFPRSHVELGVAVHMCNLNTSYNMCKAKEEGEKEGTKEGREGLKEGGREGGQRESSV